MTAASDWSCLWLARDDAPVDVALRVRGVFPQAQRVLPYRWEAQVAAVRDMGPLVLVLPEDVLPATRLAAARVDPLLIEAGVPIGWLVRNGVTGGFAAAQAPVLWSREALLARLEAPSTAVLAPIAMLPTVGGDWCFNWHPRRTLLAGYRTTIDLREASAGDSNQPWCLSLHAGLGADARFGGWWMIGACHALMRHMPLSDCLKLELREVPDPSQPDSRHAPWADSTIAARARDLVREARAATGLPLVALGPDESRMVKRLHYRMPPRSVYEDLADVYRSLGAAGRQQAERHLEAANWVWGRPGLPEPPGRLQAISSAPPA